MPLIDPERLKIIISFLYDKRFDSPCNLERIKLHLEGHGHNIHERTVRRSLNYMMREENRDKYPGLYKLKGIPGKSRADHWGWNENILLGLDIPMDLTTAITFMLMEGKTMEAVNNWGDFNLLNYFEKARTVLDEQTNENGGVPLSKKIRSIGLPQYDFTPRDYSTHSMSLRKATPRIYNAVIKNKAFDAIYSKSAYDLDDYGKWHPKRTLRDDHRLVPTNRYYPIGLVMRGPLCFVVAHMKQNNGPISYQAKHFALHKFSKVRLHDMSDDEKEIMRGQRPLDNYINTSRMDGPIERNQYSPKDITLEIYVSESVAEYLFESPVYGLELVRCNTCQGMHNRNGWRCFQGKTQDSWQLRRWLLSLKEIEILAPEELRNNFIEIATKTLQYYND